jgi:hypothetical protein
VSRAVLLGALALVLALVAAGCSASIAPADTARTDATAPDLGLDAPAFDAFDAFDARDAETDAAPEADAARDAGACVGRTPDATVCAPSGACLFGDCQLGVCCVGLVDPVTCECHCGAGDGCNGPERCCIPVRGPYDAAAGYGCHVFTYCSSM